MDAGMPEGDRLFVITDEDRRGTIWVVAIICLIYVFLLLLLRVTARRNSFGGDDWIAVGSTITGTVHYALTFTAASQGLGRSYTDVDPQDALLAGKAMLAHDVFLIVSLFLTKCSVIFLCRRLFSINMKRHIFLCDIATGVSTLWCIASALTLVVQCDAFKRIGYEGSHCSNLMQRWKAIGVVDACTEFFVVVLACVVVTPLKMNTNTKISALSSFVPRLLLIPLVALHVRAVHQSTMSINPGASLAIPMVYAEVHLVFAVFSAAIPAVNRWLRKFDTKMGGQWNTSSGGYGSGNAYAKTPSKSNTQSYPLDTMTSQASGTGANSDMARNRGQAEELAFHLRPDAVAYTWQTQVPTDTDRESGGSRQSHQSAHSEANIIRKDVQWQIHYDQRSTSQPPHAR